MRVRDIFFVCYLRSLACYRNRISPASVLVQDHLFEHTIAILYSAAISYQRSRSSFTFHLVHVSIVVEIELLA
jgi:hypothetical protein